MTIVGAGAHGDFGAVESADIWGTAGLWLVISVVFGGHRLEEVPWKFGPAVWDRGAECGVDGREGKVNNGGMGDSWTSSKLISIYSTCDENLILLSLRK